MVTSPVAVADALATALMVVGVKQGLSLMRDILRIEALFVTKDFETIVPAGFRLSERPP